MRFFTLLLSILFLNSTQAQTEITSTSFAQPGDVLKTTFTTQVDASFVNDGGENQTWDFSSLRGDIKQEIEYFSPADATGANLIPDATCVQFLGQGGGEQFFEATTEHFAALGIIGGNTTGLGFVSNTIYDKPYIIRRAMTYRAGDILTTEAKATIRLSLDDLPAFIADTIGSVAGGFIDSIGFGVELNRRDVIDGWGTLKIPGGTYDVLRETRREERRTIIEVKVPFLGWQDVTGVATGAIGSAGNFANDTTFTQVYLSNEAKEPIAAVTLSDDMQSAFSVEFKDNGVTGTHIITDDGVIEMSVTPNPATGPINVTFENLPKGDYQIGLYDLKGKLLRNQLFSSSKNITLTESRDALQSGIYFISLKSTNGTLLATEKLVIQ